MAREHWGENNQQLLLTCWTGSDSVSLIHLENIYIRRGHSVYKGPVIIYLRTLKWKHSFMGSGDTLLPAFWPSLTVSDSYLSKNLKVTVELALTLTFQKFYKWLAPQEPVVVLGLGRGVSFERHPGLGYKEGWEVRATLWLCPHKQAEEQGHLCSVTWKLPEKQPPDQEGGLSPHSPTSESEI